MGASKGYLRLAALSMHRDDDLTFAPLFMLVVVKSAAVLASHFRNVSLGDGSS